MKWRLRRRPSQLWLLWRQTIYQMPSELTATLMADALDAAAAALPPFIASEGGSAVRNWLSDGYCPPNVPPWYWYSVPRPIRRQLAWQLITYGTLSSPWRSWLSEWFGRGHRDAYRSALSRLRHH